MENSTQILQHAHQDTLDSSMKLISIKEQHIPGSIEYDIRSYSHEPKWSGNDAGMLVYNYNASVPEDNYLKLLFCVAGDRYCTEVDCMQCKASPKKNCAAANITIDVFSFHYSSLFLHQFVHNVKISTRKDAVLAFKHTEAFTKIFPLCTRKRNTLNALMNHSFNGAVENIFMNSKVHELLLYSIECLIDEKEEGFACRFLADEAGRQRIYKAREILLSKIGEPITIKELSRKVAINECYLKKGFKEVFGTTIFDFYQQQRMEHAKYLLYEKALSVTDVSALLGYSSISHFSAAFKKHTGLKPCELLR